MDFSSISSISNYFYFPRNASKVLPQTVVKTTTVIKYIFCSVTSMTSQLIKGTVEYMVNLPMNLLYHPMSRHTHLCQKVQSNFTKNQKDGRQFVLQPKNTTHIYRDRQITNEQRLDIRSFNRIIYMDAFTNIAHVQGCVTFDTLINRTLKIGRRPLVVPELLKITVGGAFVGLAVESTSHREGLFHETVEEVELLTGTGQVKTCSRENNADLFAALPNSYGTLGYILSLKVRLVETKPFVKMEYRKFTELEKYFEEIEKVCKENEYPFIDGAIFPNQMVLVLGKEVNVASQRCSNYVSEIYHKAIQSKASDCLTIKDYLSRWDHDSFWATSGTCLEIPWVRTIFGTMILRSNRLDFLDHYIRKLTSRFPFLSTGPRKERIIQDIGVSIDQCADFCRELQKQVGIYPLFVCPIRSENPDHPYPLWNFSSNGRIYCDIGFFGYKITAYDPKDRYYNKVVEEFLPNFNALKSLYSTVDYSKEKFEELYYGNGKYENIKRKYDPDQRFPTLFEKCVEHKNNK